MIDFQPIRLTDRTLIEAHTLRCGLYNCDLSFANMYCWHELYGTQWAEVEGFLVLRFRIDGSDHTGYMQPIGEGDFTTILPHLKADAEALGEPLRLFGITSQGAELLQARYGESVALYTPRATADYLYRRSDLVALTGKHYQPKRNHINRFLSLYPDHHYRPLTTDRIEECIRLEEEWCRNRGGCHDEGVRAERRALMRAFEAFDELGLQGGMLYVGDRLVAFTFGSMLNDHTFDIHIEKADTRYEGVFAMINREFARTLPEEVEYLNREEDLGVEGLRKAKLSYHPAFLELKQRAVWLSERGRACRRLWQACFEEDDPSFVEEFLTGPYEESRMHTREVEGKTVAMAHLIPFEGEGRKIGYIYGVATLPDYRGRGLASSLVEEIVERCHREGYDAVALIAASESLQSFYRELGFEGEVPIYLHTPDGFDFGTGDVERNRAMLRPLTDGITMPNHLVLNLLS